MILKTILNFFQLTLISFDIFIRLLVHLMHYEEMGTKSFVKDVKLKFIKNSDARSFYAKALWKKSKAIIFFKPIKNNIKKIFILNTKKYFFYQKFNNASHNFFNQLLRAKFKLDKFFIEAFTQGGGLTSQMKALNLCFSKIIHTFFNKEKTFLIKDQKFYHKATKKERKKFGLKKARKGFQYSKR